MQRLTIILLSITASASFAQTTFEKKYTPDNWQYGREIFQTADSGFFLQTTIEGNWRNCYHIKTDSSGDTLWTKRHGTDSIQYYCYDMTKSPDGGYIMCGDYQTALTYPSMDSYVQKIDSNGNQVWFNLFGWTTTQGGYRDHGQLVKVLKDSSVIVEGMTKDIYYSVGNYQYVGVNWNSYLAKFNINTGKFLDVTTVCLKIDTSCYGAKYYSLDMEVINNKIYWIGVPYYPYTTTWGDTTFAVFDSNLDTVYTIRNIGNYYGLSKTSDQHLLLFGSGIITKMDTLGNNIWITPNSSPGVVYEVKEISNNNFVSIGGNTFITLAEGDFYNQLWKQQVYVTKYSPTGGLTWSRVFNLPSGVNEQLGYNIIETYDKGFAFIGFSDYDIWLAKTDSLGNLNTSVTEINSKNNFLSIFPNPFPRQTTLQTAEQLTNATLTVDNCFGQTVAQIKNISGQTIVFSRNNLAAGLYFARLTQDNQVIATVKLLITD